MSQVLSMIYIYTDFILCSIRQVAPVVSMGIERLETDTLVLQCFQTLTGTKFVVTATPGTLDMDTLLQSIYEIYADYVLKVNHTGTYLVPCSCMNASFAESFLRD